MAMCLETVDLKSHISILRFGIIVGHECQRTYLDGLGIQLKTFLLVGQELLDILTLISLQLNHLTHLGVGNDGAIAR